MNRLEVNQAPVLLTLMNSYEKETALFNTQYAGEVETYRKAISQGIDEALDMLRQELKQATIGNGVSSLMGEKIVDYVGWMQWALWDLPYYAIALRPPLDHFRRTVTACGLVYISIRIFDDIIDQHFTYKGRHATLIEAVREGNFDSKQIQGLGILAALLVCFEGFSRLGDPLQPDVLPVFHRMITSLKKVVIGAMMEYTPEGEWNETFYNRLVELKNVEYWQSLYAALDPELASPLYPFWVQYYALAQYLNDVQDFEEDRRWRQPNLLSIYLSKGNGHLANCPPFQSSAGRSIQPEVLTLLEGKYQELASIAGGLPSPEREIAQLKLYESLQEVVKLGLISLPPALGVIEQKPSPLRLSWYSDIDQVVQEVGATAIEKVSCPVCQSNQGKFLFQKQGFPFNRCQNCSHVYVSPRVTENVQHHILENLDNLNMEDKYLEAQRLYAESICHLLSLKVSGARMLDIGFGHGYLMQMARAYGFEVYGIDAAQAHVDQMQPLLGSRVAHCILGRSPIPWDSFDVVVMSHILEHLPFPRASLEEVRRIMNPGGFLFIAVPDIDSMHFKIFGKHWDVINPLIHYQYFSGSSLVRLLEECQFEQPERINFPQLPEEILPRWTRLMRQMGGSENSEMIYLAKNSK